MNFIRDVLTQMRGWRGWAHNIGVAAVVDVVMQHFQSLPLWDLAVVVVAQVLGGFAVDAVYRRSRVEATD